MADMSASFFADSPAPSSPAMGSAPFSAGGSGSFFADEPVASQPRRSGTITSRSGISITEEDRLLINAIAAFQLRYGKTSEAIALLQIVNRLWPEDVQTLRLLTQALLHAEDYDTAEMTETALQRLTPLSRPVRADFLRQAILHHGRKRFAEARRALVEFLRLSKDK
jgi:tetratricopeptide (TPR) repeat protein